ncbi:MAG: type VI secretion IcmF C-terminal domain-containing protein, partial [Candidatus Eisenbacteria bacterium]|nr:type VI secretion IcmF C-terminal domain-containing protein [Candidatus Eisenbacteria bacterium]
GAYATLAAMSNPATADPVLGLESWISTHVGSDTPIADDAAHVLRLPVLAVTKKIEGQIGEKLESDWQGVYREFAQNLAGRYPIAAGAGQAVARSDFEAFFGPDGTFQSFYKQSLAGIMAEDGSPRDPSAPVNPALLTAVQKAWRIRRAFFQEGGRLGFRMTLRTEPPERPEGVNFLSSVLSIGGSSLQFRSVQPRPEEMSWPGERPDDGASLTFDLRGSADAQLLAHEGIWGFFRLLDRASVSSGGGGAVRIRWTVPTTKGDMQVTYTAIGLPAVHPLERGILRFSLPERIGTGP